jgi:hypothetical protein
MASIVENTTDVVYPGDTFTITASRTLYAQWVDNTTVVAVVIISTPTVGHPVVTQKNALLATGISSTPSLGSAVATLKFNLASTPITTLPQMGSPQVTVNTGNVNNFTTNGITVTPDLEDPGIVVIYGLTVTAISSTPTLGTPLCQTGLFTFGIESDPLVGSPIIGQKHVFIATGISSIPKVSLVHAIRKSTMNLLSLGTESLGLGGL